MEERGGGERGDSSKRGLTSLVLSKSEYLRGKCSRATTSKEMGPILVAGWLAGWMDGWLDVVTR